MLRIRAKTVRERLTRTTATRLYSSTIIWLVLSHKDVDNWLRQVPEVQDAPAPADNDGDDGALGRQDAVVVDEPHEPDHVHVDVLVCAAVLRHDDVDDVLC